VATPRHDVAVNRQTAKRPQRVARFECVGSGARFQISESLLSRSESSQEVTEGSPEPTRPPSQIRPVQPRE
jgi:hypothetical protein